MRVSCPACGRIVAGTDIDLARNAAVCRACSEVFALPPLAAAAAPASELAVIRSEPARALARPTDLRWSDAQLGERFVGEIARSRLTGAAMGVPALVWNGVMAVAWVAILSSTNAAAALCLLPHTLAGLALAYAALVQLLNRTRFELDPVRFRVGAQPLPERGTATEPTETIREFVPVERSHKPGGRGGRWTVAVHTRDGRAVPLRLQLSGPDHAAFIAARLNAALDRLRAPGGYRQLPP